MIKYNPKNDSFNIKKEEEIDFFPSAAFVITNNCNCRCSFCCDPPKEKENFDMENAKKMIDDMAQAGLKRICITGGEPLLNPHVFEILEYVKRKGILIILATNGLLTTKETVKKLAPLVDSIRFSIHGKPELHDKTAGVKGAFDKVMQSIDYARQVKIPVAITFVLNKENQDQALYVAELCEKKGVEKLCIFSLMKRGRATEVYDKISTNKNKVNQALEEITKATIQKGWKLRTRVSDFCIDGICTLLYPTGEFVCTLGNNNSGSLLFLGNMLTESAKKIWQNFPHKKNYIQYLKEK